MTGAGGPGDALGGPARDYLASLQALNALSLLMVDSDDDGRILELCTTAVGAISSARTAGAVLDGAVVRGELPASVVEAAQQAGIAGGPVAWAGRWAWALPLGGAPGPAGHLVVTAPAAPPDAELLLLRVLAQQTGVALTVTAFHERDREALRGALHASEQRFEATFRAARTGLAVATAHGELVAANPHFCALTGLPATGAALADAIDASDRARVADALATLTAGGPAGELEVGLAGADARRGRLGLVPLRAADGDQLVVQLEDVTAQHEERELLRRRARQDAALAELGRAAVGDTTMGDVARRVTQAACDGVDAVGAALEDAAGDVVASAGRPSGDGTAVRLPVPARRGGWSLLVRAGAPGVSPGDRLFLHGVAALVSAALERHDAEAALRHQALHDPLTGLPNRALLLDRLEHAVAAAARSGRAVATLFVDLDGFKTINDTAGHEEGDRVLALLAPRLRRAVRDGDTLGRLAGDEFGVVCEAVRDVAQVRAIAERLLTAIAEPLRTAHHEHVLSASIGVAVGDGASDPAALLRDADAAMYRAKRAGGGGVALYDRELHARLRLRADLERAVEHAVRRGRLRLLFQPIVDLATGRVRAVEALVRLVDRVGGREVGPAEFIPVAEQTGLVADLGRWVVEEACRQHAAWAAADGLTGLRVTVNVSARQLRGDAFAAVVARALGATGTPPSALGLEITESVLLEEDMRASLLDLRRLGLRLLLDDFGTGYTSLAHLRHLPLDAVKLDRTFVAEVHAHPQDRAIVQGVASITAALGLDLVAEGVETPQQEELVRALGCSSAQGFGFARPMPAEEVPAFVRARAEPGGRAA